MPRSTLRFALLILLTICCAALAGCSGNDAQVADAPPAPPPASAAATAEVTDDDLSYRHEPLVADSGTPGAPVTAADPGDSAPIQRSFENAPPLIPHNTDDLFPITADDNLCLDCHAPGNAADDDAPSVPASHQYDIRRDNQLSTVNPANYFCDLCHAGQADVDELVGNDFEPYFRSDESKESSNLLEILDEGAE
ncbi:nitrate reductase [bacterium]|nr:MAG: nitrate reductase [bacterium]